MLARLYSETEGGKREKIQNIYTIKFHYPDKDEQTEMSETPPEEPPKIEEPSHPIEVKIQKEEKKDDIHFLEPERYTLPSTDEIEQYIEDDD